MAAFAAFVYAFFLYRKDETLQEINNSIKWLLASARFVAVFLIAILLIGIIIEKLIDRKESPLLFVVNDNSKSILLTKDSSYYKETFRNDLDQLKKRLATKFEVLDYSFSSELKRGFDSSYTGKTTNLSTVFNTIYDQYTNRNIGGIIVASDGIYNEGANPIYAIDRKSFVPVFTIGMGDTNRIKDVRIEQVNHNDIAFLGNEFPVEVSFSHTKCNGEEVMVSIYEGERLLKQEKRKLLGNQGQSKVSFVLKADRVGFRKYRAEITGVKDEYSLTNNRSNFYIEVIDGRQKILIASGAPHPDIAAIRYVIDQNKNYEVELKKIKELTNLNPYDLVIVHGYNQSSSVLNSYLSEGKGPALLIVGGNSDLQGLSNLQIGLSGFSKNTEFVSASFNTKYKEILLGQETLTMLAKAPPLQVPFGNLNYSAAIDIMAYQKLGTINLDQPLIYFTQKQTSRFGVIMGEGIWRWRLYDQMTTKNTSLFSEFIGKLITYLAVKENKDPFKIQLNNEYTENENVVLRGEFYNKSYELINEPEISFSYENENGDRFESFFAKRGKTYQLDLGKLKQGIYAWEAQTSFQGKNYLKKGTFLVREIKIEYLNTVADHRLMKSIAANSGGGFYLPTQLAQLEQDIQSRNDIVTVVYQEKDFDDLIDYKWLFILILVLLSLEWFIRKYQGVY